MTSFLTMINVYKILQVPATASDTEIAKAYKKLSRKYHPDHGGDANDMSLLNEAYSLINTPDKRKKYDTENAFSTTFSQWEAIFGKSNVAKEFGNAPKPNPRAVRGSDIELTVSVPMSSFVRGERFMSAAYDKSGECLECDGAGVLSKCKCPVCGGGGKVRTVDGLNLADRVRKCAKCDGTGSVVKESCSACDGKGHITRKCTHSFTYKPLTLESTVVGKGNDGINGGENGNLVLLFRPVDDTDTGISFSDGSFHCRIGIHPEDFILGTTVDIDFYGNLVVYTLEPGCEYGASGHIDNVASTGYPLDLEFYAVPEPNWDISVITEAFRGVREARTGKK